MHRELTLVSRHLDEIERQLEDPFTPLDDSKFLLDTVRKNPELTEEQFQRFQDFADELSAVCRDCHVPSQAPKISPLIEIPPLSMVSPT